jgi:signal transduction histidine kinase
MSRARIPFPWISILIALLLVCWQFVLARPEWIQPYALPEPLLRFESLIAAAAVWLLLVFLEMYRFFKAWAGYKAHVAELFDSRRDLGTRARTYSDHADKLKMFISDKLLEYIEYDEKFLHFKNIASEVRHNGVISYDRAQTALKKATEVCADKLADSAQAKQFEEAGESLLYLWDLLDIATTDNITLHVANRIYDSEEYYFQSMLNKNDAADFPYEPTFSMISALRKALLPIVDNPEELRWIELPGFPFSYIDERFHLLVKADSDMLGNCNHMVLLLENLLNNAVYYADQKASTKRASRVAILLSTQQGENVIEIYNRGPWIKDEDRSRIFQLGYSSRRIRDHHGKGLGLYFVNEICKGFEGTIDFENIENQPDALSLRVELSNGEVETHLIGIVEDNGKPLCHFSKTNSTPTRSLEWSFSSPVSSVEVSSQASAEPQAINDLLDKENFSHADISDALLSRWTLELVNRKRSAKLVFRPLDVSGVRFRMTLPTALSRVENQEGF